MLIKRWHQQRRSIIKQIGWPLCRQSASLSWHPCLFPMGPWIVGHGGRDGGYAWVGYMDFRLLRLTWLQLLLSDRLASNETNTEPLIQDHSPGDLWVSHLVASWPLSSGKGNDLVLLKQTLFLLIGFLSLHIMLCQNHHPWTTECLVQYWYRISHSIASDQGTHFTTREMLHWAHHDHEIHLTMFPAINKKLAWKNSWMTFLKK